MRVFVPDEQSANPQTYVAKTYAAAIQRGAKGFSLAVYENSSLTLREFEGARVRTAEINGCQLCQNWRSARDVPGFLRAIGSTAADTIVNHGVAPDEAFYFAVSDWRTSPLYSDRERTAIEYAEKVGLDPQALAHDEDYWSRAKALFSDDEIVDLAYCVAQWMGLGRVAHVLGLDDVCMIPSRATEKAEAA